MYIPDNPSNFTPRAIAAALQLWSRAAISLLDIRHNLISPEEALRSYRLPASTFLYTSGRAEVLLDGTAYKVERFGLFHGGKGTELMIQPKSDWLEYYMVLYKAGEPSFHKREYAKMLEQTNPFRQQYGFSPENPIFLWEILRRMFEAWRHPTALECFYEKASFYQLVYEIYKELEGGQIHVLQPDVVEMAMRYLDEHYGKAIAIQDVCEMLGVSYSHFHRKFKSKTGGGPQEYLINVRIMEAKRLLRSSSATIVDIAEYCGFQDERSFRRSFVKNTGLTPKAYREELPVSVQDYALGNLVYFPYNWESQVSLGELKGKGATFMLKQMRGKAVVAAALSLMLLLSACGTTPANSTASNSTPASVVTSQVTETEATETVEKGTRMVSTVIGDVEVPENPKRIVVGGFWVGDVLALGKQPIAIQDFYVTTSSWAEQAKSIAVLEKWEPEHIMALAPDLIITGSFGGKKPDDYDALSKIAPTVAFDWDAEPEERLPQMALALGLDAADGEALVNEYNQKIEDYRKKLEEAGVLDKTITVFRNDGLVEGGLELGSEIGWGGEVVYALFGMPMPQGVQQLKSQAGASGSISNVSFEVIPELCGDYILLNQSDPALIRQLDENPIWQSIPAAQKGNILVVEPGKVYFPDIITDIYKLEVISEGLLELAAKQ